MNPTDLLLANKLAPKCLTSPNLKIPTAKVVTLLESAARQSGTYDFGLRMAQNRMASTLGDIELIMRKQPNLKSALHRLTNYLWAQSEGILMQIGKTKTTCTLSILMSPGLPKPATQTVELALASLTKIIERLVAPGWKPEIAVFDHPKPDRIIRHIQIFGQTPLFNYGYNALAFEASELNRALPSANPATARQMEKSFSARIGARPISHTNLVLEIIQHLLPQGECRADTVAQFLNVNRRTLHRWLSAEGATFRQLVETIRQDWTKHYIDAGNRSMTEISQRLGFVNLSSFSRWRRLSHPTKTPMDQND